MGAAVVGAAVAGAAVVGSSVGSSVGSTVGSRVGTAVVGAAVGLAVTVAGFVGNGAAVGGTVGVGDTFSIFTFERVYAVSGNATWPPLSYLNSISSAIINIASYVILPSSL